MDSLFGGELFEEGDIILVTRETANRLEPVNWEYAPKHAKLVRNPVKFYQLDGEGKRIIARQETEEEAASKRADFTNILPSGALGPTGPRGRRRD